VKALDNRAGTALIWILLLTMPYWMNAVGGYTELATASSCSGWPRWR
jgi:hypothetical protein